MTTLPIGNSINRSPFRSGLLLIALACFALSPTVRAEDGDLGNANTAEGFQALFSVTTGGSNTATGYDALLGNYTGSQNTATGFEALFSNNADNNTANGWQALHENQTGSNNTATGNGALQNNTTGNYNTANGNAALYSNTSGFQNTATGDHALYNNTTINGVSGNYNTANGQSALYNNTTGSQNTANGIAALWSNTTGFDNTANGGGALYLNTTGSFNTADGLEALHNNNMGTSNTANGYRALYGNNNGSANTADGELALQSNTTGNNNTANGYFALLSNTTGGSNIALGAGAGLNLTTGSNNIDIGNVGVAGESKKIRIGTRGTHTNTYIAGISGVTVAGGVGVIIDTNGHLGTVVSSERFKDQIRPMDKASEAILALKPVTFRYKYELDPEGIPQFGLVAEQVEKVNPALVARDAEGKPYTVRYEAVNAMLLNEFLKEHRTVQEQGRKAEEQERTIAQLKKGMELLTAQLRAQAGQIQKVSDQLEVSKATPQMVVSNQ